MQWQQVTPGPAAPYAAPFSSTSPPLFGVIVPGCPVHTDISAVDTGRWTVNLGVAPESFVVFLTMSGPLPPGYGIGLFLAREDTMSFQYVGAITQQRPSSIVRVSAVFLDAAQPIRIVLGLALEQEEALHNLGLTQEQPLQQSQAATKLAIAERILKDLYEFVVSYARTLTWDGGINGIGSLEPGEYVVLPASFVDKWRARVQTKLAKDNAFWA
ncbi:hypothetical protein LSCM1_06413 [Leishmania martiniquensis]|uniref:Hikeshi-like domain-containing protein n=1 Tax=Leishmania martiniquensis TaxID=1580590 RepID=A0A836GVQ1_9TRYP|nr:hypothetical protein LSCM1_06413 [Leishmania martiniquensis]